MLSKKAIILDYDGVVAESNQIKTRAFSELFKGEKKDHITEFIEFHTCNEGISREKKISYFYTEILKKRILKKDLNKKCSDFSNLVVQKIIECEKVAGVESYLKENYKKKDFFISSGTPTKEIKLILKKTNMINFFQDILGSPDSKEKHISYILNKYKYNRAELMFIGDSKTDLMAARKNGIDFILRTHKLNKELSGLFNGHKIKNFFEIKKLISH